MRLSAYKKSVEEVLTLPGHVSELKSYFNDHYSPYKKACDYILNKARFDDKLFISEFVELYSFYKGCIKNVLNSKGGERGKESNLG
jgi:hypothetical protein